MGGMNCGGMGGGQPGSPQGPLVPSSPNGYLGDPVGDGGGMCSSIFVF